VQTIIDGSEVHVDKLAKPLIEKGLNVTCEVTWERHQADAVVELCESRSFDLVMKCARNQTRADAMFKPVDWVVPKIADDLVAEFVVLGNVSRQGKAGLTIGSTAESTLDALHTNVLMVRVPGQV